jgi:hypothetical protein
MNRLLLLLILAMMAAACLFLANCSKPLDSTDDLDPTPSGGDTIFVVDTVFSSDTIIRIDTLIIETDTVVLTDTMIQTDTIVQTDTIIQTDTLLSGDTIILVDTVIVIQIDTLMLPSTFCARLKSCQRPIVWMLQNPAGSYTLEFAAAAERDHPPQALIIEVEGQEYEWQLVDGALYVLDLELPEDAVVRISSKSPHSYGHALDICLIATAR